MYIFRKQKIAQTCMAIIVGVVCFLSSPELKATTDDFDFSSFSLEELMEVEIRPTATLTRTSERNRPAAITVITQKDIQNSSARSLDELLDLYVPNLQMFLHNYEYQHIGIRGNMFDRDDKYLLLVNGHTMNERMHYGALSERDLPMLSDINRVEIVRGAGTALYGPGALYMVINIITDTANTFEGTEFTTRLGAIDEFYTWEVKHGQKFENGGGLFTYVGLAKQPGTAESDAPYVTGAPLSYDGSGNTGSGTSPVSFDSLVNHNASFQGQTKVKAYTHYTKDDYNLWFRYTRGGQYYTNVLNSLGWSGYLDQGEAYQQITLAMEDKYIVSDKFNVDYSLTYSLFDFIRQKSRDVSSHRQDKYHARVIGNWTPDQNHSLSVGGEWLHEEFGLPTLGFGSEDVVSSRFGYSNTMPRWSTDTASVMGEYQWTMSDKWTLFAGGRIDWHTFTDPMLSPRFVLIHRPTDPDTLKFILQSSVRASTAEEMKYAYDTTGAESDYEEMNTCEIRWERKHSDHLWFATSAYVSNHSVVAWSNSTDSIEPLGDLDIWGIEFEATHKTEKSKITFSHGYTKLLNFELNDNSTTTIITSEPYGVGDDLANWNNHVTKLTADYQVDDKLSLNGSLNAYWGIPGGCDYAEYQRTVTTTGSVADFNDPYEPSVFLNLGLAYKFSDNVTFDIHAYDILGWLDEDLNKRNKLVATSRHESNAYRIISPSISCTLKFRF